MTAPTPACPRCEVLESTAGEVAQHLLLFQRPGFGSLQPHGGSHSPVTPVPGDPPPFWFPGTPSRMWCTYMHANTHTTTTTTKNLKVKAPSSSSSIRFCACSRELPKWGGVSLGQVATVVVKETKPGSRDSWLPALRLPGCVGHASTCLSFLTCQCRDLAGDPPACQASPVAGPEGPACPTPGRPQEGAAWRGARAARAARGAETGSASAPSSRFVLGRGARGGSKRRREPRGSTAAARAMEPE